MQLGAGTLLFCLSQYAIPFCTLLLVFKLKKNYINQNEAKSVLLR